MDIKLLTDCIPRCIQHFDRDGYADEFDRFRAVCGEYFSVPEPSLADDFMEFAENETKKRLGRGPKLFDLRTFLCVYLCPAAALAGAEAEEAALTLAGRWNSRYPEYSFEPGSFADIASGFRTKPFGF